MHSKGVRRGGELKNRLDKTATQERGLCVLIAGWISGGDLKGSQAVSVGNSRDGSPGSNGLSLRRRTTFAAWIMFAMGRAAALLLSLGPAKLARRNLICIREQSYSS